jgi:hypothetical protein
MANGGESGKRARGMKRVSGDTSQLEQQLVKCGRMPSVDSTGELEQQWGVSKAAASPLTPLHLPWSLCAKRVADVTTLAVLLKCKYHQLQFALLSSLQFHIQKSKRTTRICFGNAALQDGEKCKKLVLFSRTVRVKVKTITVACYSGAGVPDAQQQRERKNFISGPPHALETMQIAEGGEVPGVRWTRPVHEYCFNTSLSLHSATRAARGHDLSFLQLTE